MLELTGLREDNISLSEEALNVLIKSYCRESGVRNLRKQIEKIYRKAALRIVKDNATAVSVTDENLQDFVGKPVFQHDKMYSPTTPPGVCMGLAWTSLGGSTLYVETVEQRVRMDDEKKDGGGRIEFTGNHAS